MQFRTVACAFLFSAVLTGVSHAAGTAAAPSTAPSPTKGASTSPQAPAQPSPITTQQTFGAWQANCTYAPATRAASLCVAAQQLSMQQQGKAVPLGMVIVARAATDKMAITARPYELSIMTPLGFDLTKPATLSMDNGKPVSLPYLVCNASGCLSTLQATPAMITALKAGKAGHIRVSRVPAQGGGTVTINYDMSHFSDAFGAIETWSSQKAPA
ncbi:invasion associated locus B family protein [Komagataeibacter europaeus]|uniref:invasion associated locus B family protein n=1 Tax=Komagataeibacter europaeus TaxID=33995 RepID=UPI000B3EA9D6|nr:invasion associated locus B family protein [Komagataeibacter europaeus]ARW18337.1 hypothetical protein S101446_03263 [Komagataeibacter europaeus]ARW18470.1 hypothetical protein S101446_03396 [Komagataeibacter europaeus]